MINILIKYININYKLLVEMLKERFFIAFRMININQSNILHIFNITSVIDLTFPLYTEYEI